MALKLSRGHLDELGDKFKLAYTKGFIRIFSGARPASANDTEGAAVVLAEITVGGAAYTELDGTNGLNWEDPAWNSTDKVMEVAKAVAETWQGTAGTSGTASWARLYCTPSYVSGTTYADVIGAQTAVPRFDMSVGSSGADLNLSGGTTITAGEPVVVSTCKYRLPSGE